VLQDGLERVGVPWKMIDAVFIGGSTKFKLGSVAARTVQEATERGFWVHCGRVNTRMRLWYAHELGCDSVDGSGFSTFPEREIPNALRWMDEIERQLSLLAA
jgi:EAL domain-containing protein (putative c-di-GMP-specific phosphodiesterase class I)